MTTAKKISPAHLAIGVAAGFALSLAYVALSRPRRRKVGSLLHIRRRPGVEFFKSITVPAAAEDVYDFWARFDDLPDYFTHVRRVERTGRDNEWRLSLNVPGGEDLSWDLWVTESIPGKAIAWESAPGAAVRSAGVVQFDDLGDGRTRVDVRLAYRPMSGDAAKKLAAALGASPAAMLNRDFGKVEERFNQPFPDPDMIPT